MELFTHAGMQLRRWSWLGRYPQGDRYMELLLQFGYGMMDHSRSLVEAWGGGTVILSPRDLDAAQLDRLAASIVDLAGGRALLDPQFYLPDADHGRLTSHDFWPKDYSTGSFWSGDELRRLVRKLVARNEELGSQEIILPGLFAERVDDDWVARQAMVIEEAGSVTNMPLLTTVALGADAVRSDEDVDEVLAAAERWRSQGVYLVCEHPRGDYLVTDHSWMANLLDLVAGLRLKGKRVVVGYCNHQMLALACAGASAIASGTWMNVRSFPPDKFRAQYDDEIKQRTTWYYAPTALSEYKLPVLDIAQKQGLLDELRTPLALGSSYADPLFAGAQPTAVRWTEQAAFRHYLQCLHAQVAAARKPTFEETCAAHEAALNDAEALLARLHAVAVRGQLRDFRECVEVNRAALGVLISSRLGQMRRNWANL